MPELNSSQLEQEGRILARTGDRLNFASTQERADVATITTWYFLEKVKPTDIPEVPVVSDVDAIDPDDLGAIKARMKELGAVEDVRKKLVTLRDSIGDSNTSLLTKLLGNAAELKPIPEDAQVFDIFAGEISDDIGWGSPDFKVGMVATERSPGRLLVDMYLSANLTEKEELRNKVYGFVVGAVAMQAIPYDRGQEIPLENVLVQPADGAEHEFTVFDYVLERLLSDQANDLAMISSSRSGNPKLAEVVKHFHATERRDLEG